MEQNTLETRWEIDPAKCTGCGDCVFICPVRTIKLVKKIAVLADPAGCCRNLVEFANTTARKGQSELFKRSRWKQTLSKQMY